MLLSYCLRPEGCLRPPHSARRQSRTREISGTDRRKNSKQEDKIFFCEIRTGLVIKDGKFVTFSTRFYEYSVCTLGYNDFEILLTNEECDPDYVFRLFEPFHRVWLQSLPKVLI